MGKLSQEMSYPLPVSLRYPQHMVICVTWLKVTWWCEDYILISLKWNWISPPWIFGCHPWNNIRWITLDDKIIFIGRWKKIQRAFRISITTASIEFWTPSCLENIHKTTPFILWRTPLMPGVPSFPHTASSSLYFNKLGGGEVQASIFLSFCNP